ncbi:2OG-Fe(II) oxygenase [Pusillimonas sp. CC-YST705]|uniref:2OG-Fe(II) oxygenase n=1 Tax=Mesopusillimonas faecipullorum TaxID=2755040 RepID=A0ABS8CFE5_9BURK|nr:2OG-Fe(II) oxygenase [Mesopusillimonas faecipullorum]MCB5364776.1 2OG-Fe(II) oxygenase [Mesopusillimonas faecipullorum]
MTTPTESIAQQLATLGTSSTFATRFAIAADPHLHVDNVGDIPLPITLQTAHRLCAAAQPAHHGYKDQTRLDPRVRDTWEIPAERLRFTSPEWTAVLNRALLRIGHELGVPSPDSLRVDLHNLLIYAPGQFFAVHQDSEKTDGMLGTLVITLPSSFTGGEFVVSHQGQTVCARGSQNRLGMMAFYADCHHEVRPVKQGYRVVLTYNLIAPGATRTSELPQQAVTALASELHRVWQTPAPPRWDGDTHTEPPDRLVYLLDHQYTPSGLSWQRLKGVDAQRAAALQAAARQLDAEIFLTLADVHETWSAEDDYQQHGYWSDEQEDEDNGFDHNEDHPALGDLINSEVELRHWLAPDGSKREEISFASETELCMNRLSVDCAPFQSEHEGYMGNYGNTVDRWYHRAAVVLWPRERNFVIRARQAPDWAIAQIAEWLNAGDTIQAETRAHSLLSFWEQARSVADSDVLFTATLPVAARLDDAGIAAGLLSPFALSQLTAQQAPWLWQLLERHGQAWCAERFQQWAETHQPDTRQLAWMAQELPALAQSSCTSSDTVALLARLVQQRWGWLRQYIAQVQKYHQRSTRVSALVETSAAWLGLLRASQVTGCSTLTEQIIAMLRTNDIPLEVPLQVLHQAQKIKNLEGLHLSVLHSHCTHVLETCLAKPRRNATDWSITPPSEHGGRGLDDLAAPLLAFLASPQQQRLEWPLAQARRQLIHQFIDHHELPIRHETRRTGRPYTLVLEKTLALFERDTADRQQWKKDLAWLQRTQVRPT